MKIKVQIKDLVKSFNSRLNKITIEDAVPLEIFNSDGEQIKVAYLSSDETAHTPYSIIAGRLPKRVFWDRYNSSLDTHFYTSGNIFHIHSNESRKNAILLESELIIPDVYKKVRKDIGYLSNTFENVFTWSKDLLDILPNALFIPASGVWYGTKRWGGDPTGSAQKNKLVSIVASDKSMCPMHVWRKDVALHLLNNSKVDVMGKVVNKYVSCDEIFSNYMYSIVIENAQDDYYFTEKILNCFASKTIPIYIGARKISSFFNPQGIIEILEPSVEMIDDIISNCSEEDYNNRIEAIDDNFNRVQKYLTIEDYIASEYPHVFGF